MPRFHLIVSFLFVALALQSNIHASTARGGEDCSKKIDAIMKGSGLFFQNGNVSGFFHKSIVVTSALSFAGYSKYSLQPSDGVYFLFSEEQRKKLEAKADKLIAMSEAQLLKLLGSNYSCAEGLCRVFHSIGGSFGVTNGESLVPYQVLMAVTQGRVTIGGEKADFELVYLGRKNTRSFYRRYQIESHALTALSPGLMVYVFPALALGYIKFKSPGVIE